MRNNLLILMLLLCGVALAADPVLVEKAFYHAALREMCRDRRIDVSTVPNAVALVPFELVIDSMGYAETGTFHETLSERIQAKKLFNLDELQAKWAQLYFVMGSDKTKITFNGTVLKIGDPKGWAYGGWGAVDVPVALLRKGTNSIVFSGAGSLFVDNCLKPNRSARSVDGGKTWDFDHLGTDGQYNGEYVVRLGLGRYPGAGVLWSDSIDLAALAGDGSLAPVAKPVDVKLTAHITAPAQTAVRFELRSGPTPSYDPERWSAWHNTALSAWGSLPPDHRYVQWRAFLSTKDRQATPLLRAVKLQARLEVEPSPDAGAINITRFDNQRIIRSSYPFIYQAPTPRLNLLRTKYKLDEVVADGKSEMDKLTALRAFTRHQWDNGWSAGELLWCTPLDALLLFDMAKRGLSAGFCGHYAAAFVQCAQTQGFTGRLMYGRAHAYSEIWSNDHRKWILMDVGPDVNDEKELTYHYEVDRVPVSSLEMHRRLLNHDWTGVVVKANRPENAWEPEKEPQAMKRYAFVATDFRNNQLDSPLPGDVDVNGWPSAVYWLLWRDGPRQLDYPEYPYTTDREGDLYWTLNQTAVYPSYGKMAGTLHLEFDTVTPNFSRYEVRLDNGEWAKCGETYDWALRAGANKLDVRTVNAFGKPGIVSTMEVNYAK
ncbi:MAG: hypothetical protein ACYDCO_03785 [Armatimonadota bacterium]